MFSRYARFLTEVLMQFKITKISVVCLFFVAYALSSAEMIIPSNHFADELIELDAPWEFFPGEFIAPQSSVMGQAFPITNRRWIDEGLDIFGIASYRLIVKSDSFPSSLGLYFYSTYSAYEVYVNGDYVGGVGKLGNSKTEEQGKTPRQAFYFSVKPETENLEILVYTSNHTYPSNFGLIASPYIGSAKSVKDLQLGRVIEDVFLFGILLIMGLYHILLWIFRRQSKGPLFFGILALVVALRQITVSGEKLIYVFAPFMTLDIYQPFQLFLIYPLLPLFLAYIFTMFPGYLSKWYILFASVLSGISLVANLFMLHTLLTTPYYIFSGITLFYVLFITFKAVKDRVTGARLLLAGFIVLFLIVLNDILIGFRLIDTFYLMGYGMFAFLLSQVLVIARVFSRSFTHVEILSLQLEESNQGLKKLDKLKDQFLANTSHELKTPLNGIIGLSEVLVGGSLGAVNEAQRRNLDLIIASGKRLFFQLNDLLDFSCLKEKQLTMNSKAVNAVALTSVVIALLKVSALKKQEVQLINDLPADLPAVLADEQRLEQVLHNLIGNALKFTHSGMVRVSAKCDEACIKFMVEDTGIGIEATELQNIFKAFYQSDGTVERNYGGAGLGLAITSSLVQQMDGEIFVESIPGSGSVFSFTLPLAGTDSERQSSFIPQRQLEYPDVFAMHTEPSLFLQNADAEGSMQALNVLIVDDEPANLLLLAQQLRAEAYDVATANSAAAALEIIHKKRLDIVIADVMMPQMSGYDLTAAIRQQFTAAELPVIMLTAKHNTEAIVHGLRIGANDYLAKPFSRDELIARIQTHAALAHINMAYKKFIPAEFLKALGKSSIVDFQLGDQIEANLAVMFLDIKSFTSLSEQLSPQQNFNFLNNFLNRFGPIVRKHKGFVDKYIGDEIMALFPCSKGSPCRAIEAAIDMFHELSDYNQQRSAQGYKAVDFGIGLYSGSVMMGIIGEEQRLDTTVISDVVNSASRLERLTRPMDSQILLGETGFGSQLPDDAGKHKAYRGFFRPLGPLAIRGKDKECYVYEWIQASDDAEVQRKIQQIPDLTEAVSFIKDANYEEAQAKLEKMMESARSDAAYIHLINVCDRMLLETL